MGWNSDDGRHLALTIAYASRYGFQLMLLENVAPLIQDKTFRQMLDQILSYFGYRIIFEACINVSTFQPVDRMRAILVVCHETLQVHTGNCDEIVRNLSHVVMAEMQVVGDRKSIAGRCRYSLRCVGRAV